MDILLLPMLPSFFSIALTIIFVYGWKLIGHVLAHLLQMVLKLIHMRYRTVCHLIFHDLTTLLSLYQNIVLRMLYLQ